MIRTDDIFDFERPIAELEKKLDEMRTQDQHGEVQEGSADKIREFEKKIQDLKVIIYGNLSRWQRVQISRHPNRPYSLDYINHISDEFIELFGDRQFKDDKAMIGALGRIADQRVVIVTGRHMPLRAHPIARPNLEHRAPHTLHHTHKLMTRHDPHRDPPRGPVVPLPDVPVGPADPRLGHADPHLRRPRLRNRPPVVVAEAFPSLVLDERSHGVCRQGNLDRRASGNRAHARPFLMEERLYSGPPPPRNQRAAGSGRPLRR